MLFIKYTYKEESGELPVKLDVFPDVEEAKRVHEWDLLNYAASEITGEPTNLSPFPVASPRGAPRPDYISVSETASEFGFSTLQLINNNELAVFIV